jgi:hypothetical protein
MRVRLASVAGGADALASLLRSLGHEVSEAPDAELVVDDAGLGSALARLVTRGKRPLVVPATSGRAAGLEPGVFFADGSAPPRPGVTRRKILGGDAPPPPFVVGGTSAQELFATEAARAGVLLATREGDGSAKLAPVVPEDGLVACDASRPEARAAATGAKARVAFFALDGDATGDVTPTWLGVTVPADAERGIRAFDLYAGGSSCGRYALAAVGDDDVRDAVGAIAACAEGFGVGVETARRALATWSLEK